MLFGGGGLRFDDPKNYRCCILLRSYSKLEQLE